MYTDRVGRWGVKIEGVVKVVVVVEVEQPPKSTGNKSHNGFAK